MLKRIPTLTLFFFSLDHISLLQAFRESGNCNSTYLLDIKCEVFSNLIQKNKNNSWPSGGCFQICEWDFFHQNLFITMLYVPLILT